MYHSNRIIRFGINNMNLYYSIVHNCLEAVALAAMGTRGSIWTSDKVTDGLTCHEMTWADKACSESNDLIAIHALLGLSRRDVKGSLPAILSRLNEVNFDALNKEGKLALLRTYAVAMSRHGMPDAALKKSVGDALDVHFPSNDDNINEELCRVLSYLQHPNVVSKTVALMKLTKVKASEYNAEILKRKQRSDEDSSS